MNQSILNSKIQDFISVNLRINISTLLLSKGKFKNISNKELAEQIEAKNRCKIKLPTWYNSNNIYYPNKLNIEQTSSEVTANYKAELLRKTNSLIDLTGGFGVDIFHFSKKIKNVIHCEINKNLSEIVKHNFKVLGITNCQIISENGIEFLQKSIQKLDWVYLDPSRRNDIKGKVFLLNDCLPNVPKNIDLLFQKSNNILIKTSPLLDISQGIKELKFVKEIHVIAIKNEVKELLWILEKNFEKKIKIKTINIQKTKKQIFDFELKKENNLASFSEPNKYLYEPNSAILKAGGFNSICNALNLNKLHRHSHLYSSNELIEFPGRKFEVLEKIPFNSKNIKTKFANTKANITTRNFPLKVEEIRKKFKIKDGGNIYLFFTTDFKNNKIVLTCQKV